MKFAAIVVCVMAGVSQAAYADSYREHAEKNCKPQWTKAGVLDQRMFEYCVNTALEASKEIDFLSATLGKETWFKKFSQPLCTSKWTKAGVKDLGMIAYCFKQEREAVDQLRFDKTQSNYDAELASLCFKKWQTNDTPMGMTSYCYKNEGDYKEHLKQRTSGLKLADLSSTLDAVESESFLASAWNKAKSLLSSSEPRKSSTTVTSSSKKPSDKKSGAAKATEPPPVSSALSVANEKVKRVFELAPLLDIAVQATGQIVTDKSFMDFPDVVKRLEQLGMSSIANQLLMVSVGRTALLITTKSNFTTTGNFSLRVFKAFDTETTVGTVPVYIEYGGYAAMEKEYNQNLEELESFTLQWMEKELPSYKVRAEDIKKQLGENSKLDAAKIASLLLIKDLGKNRGGEGREAEIFMFTLSRAFTLCHLEKSFNAGTWKQTFAQMVEVGGLAKNELEKKVFEHGYCSNGGPFTHQDSVITFRQCMCDSYSAAMMPKATRSSNMKEFDRILSQIFPVAPSMEPNRGVASDIKK